MDTKLENIWDLKPDGEDVSRGAGNAGLVGGELALSWHRTKNKKNPMVPFVTSTFMFLG